MKPATALLLRGLLSAALLAWLLSRLDWNTFPAAVRTADPAWALAALACGGLSIAGLAWRWSLCLQAFRIYLPAGTLLRLMLASTAAGFFSIGQLGADAAKVLLADRLVPGRRAALTASVAVDHVSALPVMALLFTCAAVQHGVVPEVNGRGFLVAAAAVGFSVIAGLIVRWKWRTLHGRIMRMLSTPEVWRAAGRAAAVSLPVWVAYGGIFYCTARAVGVEIGALAFFGITAITDAVAALPVSIAGLGVREEAFRFLLEQWHGVPPESAVALSLMGFAVLLCWGLAGCVFWFKQPETSVSP
jgi:uncharacterized membrane protein YbhN (UPF0104 family)